VTCVAKILLRFEHNEFHFRLRNTLSASATSFH